MPRKSLSIQSVQVEKGISAATAKAYLLKKLGLKVSKVDASGPNFYRFRQFDPSACDEGTFRTRGWISKTMNGKVNLVLCRKAGSKKARKAR